jgi:hypothetical protein
MTMVAFSARNEEEIKQVCKEHKIQIRPETIRWWLNGWSSSEYYLCISVENGEQRGGGHVCRKYELGSSTIILTTRRRLI